MQLEIPSFYILMFRKSPVIDLIQEHQIVPATMTIKDAIKELQDKSAHCLVVVDESGCLKGVFTEEDVVNKILDKPLFGTEPITDFTNPNPLSLTIDSGISAVIDMMGQNNIRYIPLCDNENKPNGLFSIRELIYYMAEKIEFDGNRYILSGDENEKPLGHSQEAIIEVMNLPISFALSRYGLSNIVRLSVKDDIGDALNAFKGSGMVAGLVFKETNLEGLFCLRDIPFNMLHREAKIDDLSIEDYIKPLPKTVHEEDTVGAGICAMAENELLFLHYKSNEKRNGLITARGLLAYMYAHIYDDE
jgi:CBS domain-containing protein